MTIRIFGGENVRLQEQKRLEDIKNLIKSAQETLPRSAVKITTKEGLIYQGYAEIIQDSVKIEPLTRIEEESLVPLKEIQRVEVVI